MVALGLPDGSVVVGGHARTSGAWISSSPSTGPQVDLVRAGLRAFLVSFDAAGRVLWSRVLAGVSDPTLVPAADGFVLALDQWDDCRLPGPEGSPLVAIHLGTFHGALLARFDAAGHARWATAVGYSRHMDVLPAALVADGDAVAAAFHFIGQCVVAEGRPDERRMDEPITRSEAKGCLVDTHTDAVVVRLDAKGQVDWTHVLATPGAHDLVLRLVPDAAGLLVVPGDTSFEPGAAPLVLSRRNGTQRGEAPTPPTPGLRLEPARGGHRLLEDR